jgi:hypothetical protein
MAVNNISLTGLFSTWITTTNAIGADVGDLTALVTPVTSNLVAAINSLDSGFDSDFALAFPTDFRAAFDSDILVSLDSAMGTGLVFNALNKIDIDSAGFLAAFESSIDHDNLTNFTTNKHIDHSGVTIVAGKGLSGGGTIAATRTLNIDSAELIAQFVGTGNPLQAFNTALNEIASVTFDSGDLIYFDGINLSNLNIGVNGQALKIVSGLPEWGAGSDPIIHCQYAPASGTGTTSISGATVVPLDTTLKNTITGASLATNQITLPAGDYFAVWSVPYYYYGNAVRDCRSQLWDDTASAFLGSGLSLGAATGGSWFANSISLFGQCSFTLSVESDLELMATGNLGSMGIVNTSGENEIYGDIVIYKR